MVVVVRDGGRMIFVTKVYRRLTWGDWIDTFTSFFFLSIVRYHTYDMQHLEGLTTLKG